MSNVDFRPYKRIVQYFWDPEPKNDDASKSPIWCMGKEYSALPTTKEANLLTYQPSPNSEPSALRNGQDSERSLKRAKIAATNGEHEGVDAKNGGSNEDRCWPKWRLGTRQKEERQLVALFADDPNAPFSLHRFVEHGASACGKHPGEWFGPSATARCIKALSEEYSDTGLNVYITGDGADVYTDSFLETATADDGTFIPTLILVGIRLGIDRVTPVYWEALKSSLQLSQSVGIAGGRPSSSHYFVGLQGDQFFYLDPHHTRPALPFRKDITEYTEEEINSCHTRRLRRLSIKDMDPSMLIGFFIKDELDWESWRSAVSKIDGKPVVHVADTEPALHSHGHERESAVDDVETFDDEDEGDGELVERLPS